MDLRQLEYFVRVAELGSFSRAAAVLRIAQPALSRQVRQLELEFKQTLLYRNGRGATPTDAGRRLLEHARGLLEQADRTRRAMSADKDALVGRVAIGLPPTLASILSVPLVLAFKERYPAASLVIVEGLTTAVHDWLTTGRVDIGALYNPAPSPAVELMPWREEPLFLIGRRADPEMPSRVALRNLASYPLVIPSRPNAFRMLVETKLAAISMKPSIAIEIDGVPAILGLVRAGHGYAVLPGESVRSAASDAGLAAVPIVRPQLAIPLSLAVSSYRAQTPLQSAVLRLVREVREKATPPALTPPAPARRSSDRA